MLGTAIGDILGGFFGGSDKPYKDAMDQYRQWAQKGADAQQPFWEAGRNAIPGYNQWLNGMSDPSGFINNLLGNYQQSPYAKYLQQQSIRAGQNAASAGGLLGSTPFAQQLQQNATNISNQDLQSWLGNVLGINSQYGQGLSNEIGWGANAANQLTNLYNGVGGRMGEAAFGRRAGRNQDFWNGIGGGIDFFDHFFNRK